jgi:hypothetical protein
MFKMLDQHYNETVPRRERVVRWVFIPMLSLVLIVCVMLILALGA